MIYDSGIFVLDILVSPIMHSWFHCLLCPVWVLDWARRGDSKLNGLRSGIIRHVVLILFVYLSKAWYHHM